MSSTDVENVSGKIQTAESQAPLVSQSLHMGTEVETEEAEVDAPGISSKRKMKSRSKNWDFFKKVKRPIHGSSTTFEVKAVCVFCETELNADSKKCGTSGLKYHMEHCQKNPSNSQKTILSYIPPEGMQGEESNGILKNWNFDKEAVRKALAYMVITDELPFRFVEHVGFQHFMRVACPMFSIPSRWTVGRDCYVLYEEEKVKFKAFLKKSAQRVCLTTDTWTSLQRINYLCLTVHFVDDNWNLNKRILNFVPISSHRGEDIGIVIEHCLAEWGFTNVFMITVDNAASNHTAIAYLRKKLIVQNACVLGGKYLHMRCIAHIINLVVVDGLKSMNHSISRIRNAIRYVRQSPSRWKKFKECILHEKIDNKSHVCLDVRTRWNSTYMMLESAVKFESAFERLELVDPCYGIELGSKKKGKVVAAEVADFEDELDSICEENQVCDDDNNGVPAKEDWANARSSILYLLEELKKENDKGLASMAVRMRLKYDKYWGNVEKMNMLVYFAAVLDPRLKLEYVKWTFAEIYQPGDQDIQVETLKFSETVKNALNDLFNEYMRINNCIVGRKEGSATSRMQSNVDKCTDETQGCLKLVSLYMMHKSKVHTEENRTELDTYLKEETECHSLETEFDILSWWKMHSPRFPILSQLARDVLAIPISTVASESAFSTSGRILDAFRSSLTPRLVQALICTQDWIRSRAAQSKNFVEEDIAGIEKLDEDLVKLEHEKMAYV